MMVMSGHLHSSAYDKGFSPYYAGQGRIAMCPESRSNQLLNASGEGDAEVC